MSALPTHASQLKCLRYILSQGVKEGLVARPIDWPGLHCAKALLKDSPDIGQWFQASEYHQAKARNELRTNPKKVSKRPFYKRVTVRLEVLPALEGYQLNDRTEKLRAINIDIIKNAVSQKGQAKVVGIKKVVQASIYVAVHQPPWWTKDAAQLPPGQNAGTKRNDT